MVWRFFFTKTDLLSKKKEILLKYFSYGTIHLRRRHALGEGGGVKNLPNFPTDSTKKLPMVGG